MMYDGLATDAHASHARIVAAVPDQSTVLEVGCATGYLSAELQRRGCRVYGVELDEQAAERARPHCVQVLVGDAASVPLPFSPAMFDCVLCGDVLEHLARPEEVLERVRPLLKGGGRLVVSIPNVANWSVRWHLLRGKFDYASQGILDRNHLRFFTLRTATELLKRCGYRVVQMDVTPGLTHFIPARRWWKPWMEKSRRLQELEYRLARSCKTLLAFQFILVAEREEA
ncbi:MAG: class I SAM-dependent methyltransferase [Acidobacteria bacterium]|nr:class I SAM-dependent methyltransferase [Acidobacteriota bacterium]